MFRFPKPYSEKERHCPFYGFTGHEILIDSGRDECALRDSPVPCAMKLDNLEPCWANCPANTKENRKALKGIYKVIRVFPDEFESQKNADIWKGFSLKQWMKYIWKKN